VPGFQGGTDEIVHKDLWNYKDIEEDLKGFDACFFCLGTTSSGKTEAEYNHITYELTLAAANTLVRLNPQMTFIYISADGADSSEKGSVMWSRIRGKTENALLSLPFKGVYIFRPAFVEPLPGFESKTTSYRIIYRLISPFTSLIRWAFPSISSSVKEIAQAMIILAEKGNNKKILKSRDIVQIAQEEKE
jgi:uncharacterized protein YbjT (DUF2867 family)